MKIELHGPDYKGEKETLFAIATVTNDDAKIVVLGSQYFQFDNNKGPYGYPVFVESPIGIAYVKETF